MEHTQCNVNLKYTVFTSCDNLTWIKTEMELFLFYTKPTVHILCIGKIVHNTNSGLRRPALNISVYCGVLTPNTVSVIPEIMQKLVCVIPCAATCAQTFEIVRVLRTGSSNSGNESAYQHVHKTPCCMAEMV